MLFLAITSVLAVIKEMIFNFNWTYMNVLLIILDTYSDINQIQQFYLSGDEIFASLILIIILNSGLVSSYQCFV